MRKMLTYGVTMYYKNVMIIIVVLVKPHAMIIVELIKPHAMIIVVLVNLTQ
jgi:hypothetical protein